MKTLLWMLLGIVIVVILCAVQICWSADFDQLRNSCVEIQGDKGGGAGVIYEQDEDYLYILTARHVVFDDKKLCKVISVQIKGKYFLDKYIDIDHDNVRYHDKLDIAHIKLKKNKDDERTYDHSPLGAEAPVVGDVIYTMGHPFCTFYYMVNAGIVAGEYDRTFIDTTSKNDNEATCMLITNSTYTGNSGGPAINKDNELVGIVFGILYTNEGVLFTRKELYYNISFAIKYDDIMEFVFEVIYADIMESIEEQPISLGGGCIANLGSDESTE